MTTDTRGSGMDTTGSPFPGRRDPPDHLVGIIDEQLAKSFWPNQNPLGKRIRIGQGLPWIEVIGVAGHVQNDRLDQDVRPQVYWNYQQRGQDRMVLLLRARRDPEAIQGSVIDGLCTKSPSMTFPL